MAVNQVIYGGETLIDLRDDTVTPETLAEGITAHTANGERVVGVMIIPTKVSQLENDAGYLTEHQDISGKLDADKLPQAIESALAQAKASGEFKGQPGDSGVHYGAEQPTSDNHPLWIDPNGGESNELLLLINSLIEQKRESFINDSFELDHPVSSYFWTDDARNPKDIFGGRGTWEQITDRFLLAAGSEYSAGSTGGEATHVLTIDEMPSHTHIAKGWAAVVDGSGSYKTLGAEGKSRTYSPDPAGGDQAHNNMPPYLAAYCWKRVA